MLAYMHFIVYLLDFRYVEEAQPGLLGVRSSSHRRLSVRVCVCTLMMITVYPRETPPHTRTARAQPPAAHRRRHSRPHHRRHGEHSPTARQPHSNGLCAPPKEGPGTGSALRQYICIRMHICIFMYISSISGTWRRLPPPSPLCLCVCVYIYICLCIFMCISFVSGTWRRSPPPSPRPR